MICFAIFPGGDADKLVDRIMVEVLRAVEASFEKKIDPVLRRLETCS